MSILIEDSGTPVVTPAGNLFFISGVAEFKQRIINVFSTFLNSEILHPDYGFDFVALNSVHRQADRNVILQTLAFETLNPENVFNLGEVLTLNTSVTGTTGMIDVTIYTKDGNTYNSIVQIAEEI